MIHAINTSSSLIKRTKGGEKKTVFSIFFKDFTDEIGRRQKTKERLNRAIYDYHILLEFILIRTRQLLDLFCFPSQK